MSSSVVLRHPEVWVVIAAYNEERVIAEVLLGLGELVNIVCVDDCSRDGTPTEIERLLDRVPALHFLRHPVNLGQGAALQTGIRYALSAGAKYLVTFDADGQHTPESLPDLLAPLERGECDVVLGSRFLEGGSAVNISPRRAAFLSLATAFTKAFTQLKITDTHNGLRAFSAAAAAQLSITQNRMAHATQILVQIRKNRFRYCEVPVKVVYSDYSTAKGQKMSNALNIVWDSFTEFFWN